MTTPVEMLWGESDTITPPKQAEIMKEKLPNANLKFYKNWTHAPYIADPEGLARAIVHILKEDKA